MDHKEFQLVLQLPATSGEDFDELIAIEDAMEITFAGLPHEVDGHDFGSGEMNIFIHTNDPQEALRVAKGHYSPRELAALKAAYRRFDEGAYVNVWPIGTEEPFVVG